MALFIADAFFTESLENASNVKTGILLKF